MSAQVSTEHPLRPVGRAAAKASTARAGPARECGFKAGKQNDASLSGLRSGAKTPAQPRFLFWRESSADGCFAPGPERGSLGGLSYVTYPPVP
jgi:hypothetical protein